MQERSVAILIDGGYFLRRIGGLLEKEDTHNPVIQAKILMRLCYSHLDQLLGQTRATSKSKLDKTEPENLMRYAYRIFYYDAYPYDGKSHDPVSNQSIDFAKSDVAKNRLALFDLLRKKRKFALRLGRTKLDQDWTVDSSLTKPLLRLLLARLQSSEPILGQFTPDEIKAFEALKQRWTSLQRPKVKLGIRQKGVDMRIGIDIASLALKKQVHTIILVAGDSDFVPAAKLARREGIDFILDPLWQKVEADLFEHIDGMQSGLPKPTDPNELTHAN